MAFALSAVLKLQEKSASVGMMAALAVILLQLKLHLPLLEIGK
jgi:hypothetical protein